MTGAYSNVIRCYASKIKIDLMLLMLYKSHLYTNVCIVVGIYLVQVQTYYEAVQRMYNFVIV